jgi:hypothetical protein
LKHPSNPEDRNSRDARLPLLERQAGALAVKAYASFAPKEKVLAGFRDETARVLTLARRVPDDVGRRRTRIRRRIGMEASSRDWSVFMTIEHLVIVNRGITAVIHALCADSNPGVEIGVEDIQPHPDAGPEHIEALSQAADRYVEIVDHFGGLRCHERYRHPWFGPLSACEWNVLAAWHNHVHRRQLQRLLKVHGIPAG